MAEPILGAAKIVGLWWCSRCQQWVDGICVTHSEEHDPVYGGCGFLVMEERPVDDMAFLLAEVKRLRGSLLRYGRHDDDDVGPQPCKSHECGPETCDCGLDAALKVSNGSA